MVASSLLDLAVGQFQRRIPSAAKADIGQAGYRSGKPLRHPKSSAIASFFRKL
jgi:hypothetical protein